MGQSKAKLKALRKKYHLGEFSKRTKRKSPIKRKKINNSMVRKKTRVVYRKAPRKVRRRTSKFNMNPILGLALYGLAENTIDNVAANFNVGIPTDIIQTGLGYYFMGKSGIIGSTAKAMFYVNGVSVMKSLLSGGLNIFGGNAANVPVSNGW